MRLLPLLLLSLLPLPACQNFTFKKADSTAVDMTSASKDATALSTAAAEALAAYDAVLAPSGSLKDSFGRFTRSVDGFARASERVKAAIDSVEKNANAFLAEYAKRREEIKNTDLRAAMLMRKESIERQIGDLKVELSATMTACDSLNRELTDLRTFFAANLNEQAVQGAAPVGETLRRSLENLEKSVARVNLELADLATSLSSQAAK